MNAAACRKFFQLPELFACLSPLLSRHEVIQLAKPCHFLNAFCIRSMWRAIDLTNYILVDRLIDSPEGLRAHKNNVDSVRILAWSLDFSWYYVNALWMTRMKGYFISTLPIGMPAYNNNSYLHQILWLVRCHRVTMAELEITMEDCKSPRAVRDLCRTVSTLVHLKSSQLKETRRSWTRQGFYLLSPSGGKADNVEAILKLVPPQHLKSICFWNPTSSFWIRFALPGPDTQRLLYGWSLCCAIMLGMIQAALTTCEALEVMTARKESSVDVCLTFSHVLEYEWVCRRIRTLDIYVSILFSDWNVEKTRGVESEDNRMGERSNRARIEERVVDWLVNNLLMLKKAAFVRKKYDASVRFASCS
ncbi:MAG: hypothetical protein J3R72DRAFT_495459 [Linnemannia gamsii]|nr:MAG: hypothetical protein J3R72DRAFT_495459 [Linnemannia gamsii]